jgi:hypothetical protein
MFSSGAAEMNGPPVPLPVERAFVTALIAVCLMAAGCGIATDAQTAVIVPVDWDGIGEIRHVRYSNRSSQLAIAATLSNGEEVTCTRRISWEQGDQLTSGRAALTVKSKDGQFLDAWITIVPD